MAMSHSSVRFVHRLLAYVPMKSKLKKEWSMNCSVLIAV